MKTLEGAGSRAGANSRCGQETPTAAIKDRDGKPPLLLPDVGKRFH